MDKMTTKKYCNLCGHVLTKIEESNKLEMGTLFGVPTRDWGDYLFDRPMFGYGHPTSFEKLKNKEYLLKRDIQKSVVKYEHGDICNECLKIARKDQERTMNVLNTNTPRAPVINKENMITIKTVEPPGESGGIFLFFFFIGLFLAGFVLGAFVFGL